MASRNHTGTRTQVTTVNGHVSSSKSVTCGTAQGSILGPLIYIIYVNDVLSLLNEKDNMYLYADDMLIISNHMNVEVMLLDLQAKINRIYNWCVPNKLNINEAKTKYMVVDSGKVEPIGRISINNRVLGKVTQYEYLGMRIDHKLNMDNQIESMFKKANKKLGILSRIRMFITCNTATRIYKTMIRPHLEYVDFIVESGIKKLISNGNKNGSKKLISKLYRFQERALRKIEYCKNPEKRKEYSSLGNEYGIECLAKRRKRSLIGHMFHQSKDEINVVKNKCDRILRSHKNVLLKSNFSNLTKLHNSLSIVGFKIWNRYKHVSKNLNLRKRKRTFMYRIYFM